MPRPPNANRRSHQLNIRFNGMELATVHHHAGLIGKTPADFARAVMLRRPRLRKSQPALVIALSEPALKRWHALGLAINDLAHRCNRHDQPPLSEIRAIVASLRMHLRRSFPQLPNQQTQVAAYTLTPAVRYHLRKTCTNLVQIADRHRSLGLLPPLPLSNLIARFRLILNTDTPPHGP